MGKPIVKNRKKHLLSICFLDNMITKLSEKPPKLKSYNVNEGPYEHAQHFDDHLDYYHANEAEMCNLFALTLTGP